MDLEERERFFAAGGPAGRFDGPPGGPPGGMGPPGGGRAPPPHPSEHTPQSQNDWGPSREGRESSREVLARQRQAEYNEQKARQERNREAALEQKRRGGAMIHDHGDPRFAHGGGETRDSPGMMFDENNEQRPRPKGFHGLRDIHDASDAKRRVAADEKKRAYAADLQRQIDEAKTRKQLAKQRSLDVDRHNLGMHNIIPDMRGDGRLDGFDERGNSMGYTYADAHPPDAPRPYHPTNDGSVRTYDDDAHDVHDVHANHHEAPQHDPRSAAASAHQNASVHRAPSERGYVGPPGGHFADGVAAGARAEKMRKKQAYQRDLELQIAEKARRKAAEKLAQQELDSRDARAAMRHDPWGPVSRGRGGGGAPMAYSSAPPDAPGARPGYDDDRQSGQSVPSYGEPSTAYPVVAPESRDSYPTQIVPGGRAGVPGHGRFAASASNPNPSSAPPASAAPVLSRGGAFARGHEDMHPAELEAKSRARDELQHALRMQIEEKRARKEEEKARREAEEAADQRRLAIEQEKLREAFEREQAIERAKAEERMRAEEEAFQAAAEKRRERKLVDMPEPRDAPPPRGDEAEEASRFPARIPDYAHAGPPPAAAPPPPRGPTPAGARELNQLRSELQQEHRELMSAMQQQNANMALLQKRAEMAERHSAEARVELAEMRENLADQAFVSSLPPVVSNGDPMTAHGVELPIYMSKTTDAITGPPHVAPDEDYGVFIRDAAGPHHQDNDLGPALDAGAPFVALGSSANDLAGQLGKEMGVGVPGVNNPSAKLLVRRGGLDVDDDVGSIVGDSAFIFPGQTVERAPFLKGSGASVFSGPGAERPAPEVGPRRGSPRSEDPKDGGVGLAERFGGPEKPLGGDAYDDGPEAAGMSTRDADASRKLDAVYQKNAARMRALGVAPETAPNDADARIPTNSDPDQLEDLLRNFLKANRGESGGVSAFDAGEPPSVERGEFDDPALGLNVEGAEDEDFGLGRPNTQMSMQAETRFVGSQY